MSLVQLVGNYTLDQTLNIIKEEVPKLGISLEFVDEGFIESETGLTYLIVYEKYFMRVGNRVSLSIMVSEVKGKTQIVAIASGASQSVLFSFDWGSEDDFVSEFTRLMLSYQFYQN